jgi:hypothetical protein
MFMWGDYYRRAGQQRSVWESGRCAVVTQWLGPFPGHTRIWWRRTVDLPVGETSALCPATRTTMLKNDPDHTRLYSEVASALSRRIEAVDAESTARTALDAARKAMEVEEDQPARVSLFMTREDRISEHHAAEHDLMEADTAWRHAVDELNRALQSG